MRLRTLECMILDPTTKRLASLPTHRLYRLVLESCLVGFGNDTGLCGLYGVLDRIAAQCTKPGGSSNRLHNTDNPGHSALDPPPQPRPPA
jgi:hypothetical protein